jgi:hypothetical protein
VVCRIERQPHRLRERLGVPGSLTRRQTRRRDYLIGTTIGFGDAIVSQQEMRPVARKIICHRRSALP